jgi:hypothetical protein
MSDRGAGGADLPVLDSAVSNVPRMRTATIAGCTLLLVVLATALALAPGASASTRQLSILQDGTFLGAPATALPQARALGASTIRVFVPWFSVAPASEAKRRPHFDASNPNAYPRSAWKSYDTLVRNAQSEGITVDLEPTGGPPRWAEGANPPRVYRQDRFFGWRPNPKLYGQFVHALAERYDGRFVPEGATSALPAVHFWSFWNEPNFGQDLGPQAVEGSTRPVAPKTYRALLAAGWRGLHEAQPRTRDTILIGELAATGYALPKPGHPGSLPGVTAQMRALVFVRALYCVDDRYHPLQGSIARLYGCPATPAASRGFRARNPALFQAGGFADHPYSSRRAPNADPAQINRDYATFPVLRHVAAVLDHVTAAYGAHPRLPIYNDEYGYITSPPQPGGLRYPSPAKAAAYINQAEYLSYKDPRVASYAQYLLDDPMITKRHPHPGFASGLYTQSNQPKATLSAYRLPVWLPRQTVRAGSSAEIWGCARPAPFATGDPRTVSIQMRSPGAGSWTTIRTVKVSTATGYFDIHMMLPYSGSLRLAYTYPQTEPFLPPEVGGSTIYGRTVKVTVTR